MKKVIPTSLSKQLNPCELKHKCKDKIIKVLKDKWHIEDLRIGKLHKQNINNITKWNIEEI